MQGSGRRSLVFRASRGHFLPPPPSPVLAIEAKEHRLLLVNLEATWHRVAGFRAFGVKAS